jgi:predicted metal-dependent enzyme (double-stranded beta helix superfamily)
VRNPIKGLVQDLKALRRFSLDDAAMARAVRNVARRMVIAKDAWLHPSMCVAGSGAAAGIHPLHEEADHSLAIFVVTWMPGEETPPHDHGTWAVIAGLAGRETNHWWKRHDDAAMPHYADVRRAGADRIEPGTIITMGGDAIHSLHNDSGAVSTTLHLYGHNVDFTDRRKYDPAHGTIAPYRLGLNLRA